MSKSEHNKQVKAIAKDMKLRAIDISKHPGDQVFVRNQCEGMMNLTARLILLLQEAPK